MHIILPRELEFCGANGANQAPVTIALAWLAEVSDLFPSILARVYRARLI
jgi:hypothetical protein